MSQSTSRGLVQVVDWNPAWPDLFCTLRDKIWPLVRDIAVRIEHVGSTSVAGLAAKPIIDLDIVIPSRSEISLVATRLGWLGYEHRGNQGIEDREVFWKSNSQPAHNLYVCSQASVSLRNHVAFRDHLRVHELDALAYSRLKKQLAAQYVSDPNRYVAGKTDFIVSILTQHGFSLDHLDSIRNANAIPGVGEIVT